MFDNEPKTCLYDVSSWVHPPISKGGCREGWMFFQTWGLVPLTDSVQVLACEGEEIWGTFKLEPGLNPATTRCSNVFRQLEKKNPIGECKCIKMFSLSSNFTPYWKTIPKTWDAIKCSEIQNILLKNCQIDPVRKLLSYIPQLPLIFPVFPPNDKFPALFVKVLTLLSGYQKCLPLKHEHAW